MTSILMYSILLFNKLRFSRFQYTTKTSWHNWWLKRHSLTCLLRIALTSSLASPSEGNEDPKNQRWMHMRRRLVDLDSKFVLMVAEILWILLLSFVFPQNIIYLWATKTKTKYAYGIVNIRYRILTAKTLFLPKYWTNFVKRPKYWFQYWWLNKVNSA